MMEIKQVDQGHEIIFEAYDGAERLGHMVCSWTKQGSELLILHTLVEPKHEGKGIGSALLDSVVDFARQQDKKISTVCSFVIAKFRQSDAYDDVKAHKD